MMYISELVSSLNEVRERFGDIEVRVTRDDRVPGRPVVFIQRIFREDPVVYL